MPARVRRRVAQARPVREVARALLGGSVIRRRVAGTPHRVYIPAGQHLGLLGWGQLTYEPQIAAVFREYIPRGGVVADVGANIGFHTALAASLTGLTGSVTALEPDPQSLVHLMRTVRANGMEQVVVRAFAVADREGAIDLHLDVKTPRTTSLLADAWSPDAQTRYKVSVGVTTLDKLYASAARLDFVKIDVEGAELAVLRGGAGVIQRLNPVLLVEVLPPNLAAALALLEAWGYIARDVATGAAVTEAEFSGNLFALPPGTVAAKQRG